MVVMVETAAEATTGTGQGQEREDQSLKVAGQMKSGRTGDDGIAESIQKGSADREFEAAGGARSQDEENL
jgi:hypothetical protein